MANPSAEPVSCACCGERLAFRWSDTHGIGVCSNCGLPYRLYHYEDDKRVEKPSEVAVTSEGVEIAKRYWAETKRRVFPGCYDMGIGQNGYSYSGASPSDYEAFDKWYRREYPQPEVANG